FLLELAEADPRVLGVVGWLDLRAADAADRLERLAEHKAMKGLRHLVQDETDPSAFLQDAAFNAGVKQVLARDMVYEVLVHAQDLPAAVAFCARHEGRLVLDHMAKPDVRHDGFAFWRKHMAELAAIPHVSCKLSGLVTEAVWGAWTQEQLRPYFAEVLELFGPHRVLFGSDWPVCLLSGSYDAVVDLLHTATGTLTSEEKEALWGMNACRIYNL
ncbi:MAG: amidohydrolase family protein, partial [Bilophila sp.]